MSAWRAHEVSTEAAVVEDLAHLLRLGLGLGLGLGPGLGLGLG